MKRLEDEALHRHALNEVTSGRRRDGLWAKAVIKSGGNEMATQAEYLRLVVEAIRDEEYIAQRIQDNYAPFQEVAQNANVEGPEQVALANLSQEDLMRQLGIVFDGGYYRYREYRYTKAQDAVDYALLQLR